LSVLFTAASVTHDVGNEEHGPQRPSAAWTSTTSSGFAASAGLPPEADRIRGRQRLQRTIIAIARFMILVALDGSPRAPAVLQKAIATARAQGARLTLLRSVGVSADIPQDLWRSSEQPMSEILSQRAREYLAACEELVPQDARGDTKVVVGSPWQSICETARTLRADLIVIGSHGYSNIDRFLGTTAAKVVDHASCSVLVVREAPDDARPS
jgi:nucleotide-binding universal stress UspA family protein